MYDLQNKPYGYIPKFTHVINIYSIQVLTLSGGSVVKIEGHVGKKRDDVGKNKAHVGKIAIDVGISKKPVRKIKLIKLGFKGISIFIANVRIKQIHLYRLAKDGKMNH